MDRNAWKEVFKTAYNNAYEDRRSSFDNTEASLCAKLLGYIYRANKKKS